MGDEHGPASERKRDGVLDIVDFHPDFNDDFRRITLDWVRKYFSVEPGDERVISDPKAKIIDRGGSIVFARIGAQAGCPTTWEIVGTCALVCHGAGRYELSKMGVTDAYQGRGVGRALLNAIVQRFHARAGQVLFLETNRKLGPAMQLYASVGFEEREPPRPSPYARTDVYMEYTGKQPL